MQDVHGQRTQFKDAQNPDAQEQEAMLQGIQQQPEALNNVLLQELQ